MIGQRRCTAVSALIDLPDVNNSLLMLRKSPHRCNQHFGSFRINPRVFSRASSPIMHLPNFPTLWPVCVSVYIGLCTCTLGLSWLGLWKVPGQTPSSNNKRDRTSKYTGLLRLTLTWESRLEFPAKKEMDSLSVFTFHTPKANAPPHCP